MNGRLVSSPDPTLNAGTPRPSSRSAAPSSNGVDRNSIPRSWARRWSPAQASAGRASRASISRWSAPDSPARRWYAAVGAPGEARAAGSKVWNLTASAPAAAAASISRAAIAGSPLWLTPASAITNTGPSPIRRSPIGTGRMGRAASTASAASRSCSSSTSIARSAGIDMPMVRPGSTNRRDRASSAASTT